MHDRHISIGLLWHTLDSGNHGVNALTVANRALAADAARQAGLEPQFTIFGPGFGPKNETTPEGDAVVRLNKASMLTERTFWQKTRQLDVMLDISAGDSFADIYGLQRFLWMWVTKQAPLMSGVPLILSPQTIGPFTRQPYKRMAGGIMRRALLTVARDPQSYDAIGTLSPKAKRMLSADVAFRLPFVRRSPVADGKLHVGVNVSGLLWQQSRGGGNQYGLSYDYADMTTTVLDALSARDGTVVHLITHVVEPTRPRDDDAGIVDELAAKYPNAIRVPNFAGPSEAKSYISGLNLLIAARMHACIAAFSSGVPVLPVAYSRKFDGLFTDLLGYDHVLPRHGHDGASAADFILRHVGQLDEMRAAISVGNERAQSLLGPYETALSDIFRDIAEHKSQR